MKDVNHVNIRGITSNSDDKTSFSFAASRLNVFKINNKKQPETSE